MATFTSKATGNWDTEGATTWNEAGHPIAGDTVTIQNSHTITLDSNAACETFTIENGGVLNCSTFNFDSVNGTIDDGGTLDMTSGNLTMTQSGPVNCLLVNGTLNLGTGTHSIGANCTYWGISIGSTGIVDEESSIVTYGTVNVAASATYTLSSISTTISSAYTGIGDCFNVNSSSIIDYNSGELIFTYAGNCSITNANSTNPYNLTVNNASCVLNLKTNNLSIDNNLTITAGEFTTTDGTSRNLSVTGKTSLTGTLTCNSSTIALGTGLSDDYGIEIGSGGIFVGGSGDHTIWAIRADNCTITLTSGTTEITGYNSFGGNNYSLVFIDDTFDDGNGTIKFTHASDRQELWCAAHVAHTFYNLEIDKTAGTVQFGNNAIFDITITNNFTITSGTFNTNDVDNNNSGDLTIGGDLINSDTFVPNDCLVTLNGTNQSLTGDWTFWSFAKSVSTADTLTFDNTASYTFGGNVTLNGTEGELLSLVSDSDGNAFDFIMLENAVKTNLSYLSVKDSDASSSHSTQKPINPSNSIDVSGNTDWGIILSKGGNRIINSYYY